MSAILPSLQQLLSRLRSESIAAKEEADARDVKACQAYDACQSARRLAVAAREHETTLRLAYEELRRDVEEVSRKEEEGI